MGITTNVKTVTLPSKKNFIPITSKWKGVSYIRSHSFLATVRDIISFSAEIHVCRIGLIG